MLRLITNRSCLSAVKRLNFVTFWGVRSKQMYPQSSGGLAKWLATESLGDRAKTKCYYKASKHKTRRNYSLNVHTMSCKCPKLHTDEMSDLNRRTIWLHQINYSLALGKNFSIELMYNYFWKVCWLGFITKMVCGVWSHQLWIQNAAECNLVVLIIIKWGNFVLKICLKVMHSTVFPSTHVYRLIHTSVTTYKDSCGGRVKRLR